MTDQDREAFENWYQENVSVVMGEDLGKYHDAHAVFGEDVKAAWQGARGHYAPRLTEDEFKDILRDAIADETPVLEAMETFRAAGVRFKEGA